MMDIRHGQGLSVSLMEYLAKPERLHEALRGQIERYVEDAHLGADRELVLLWTVKP